MPYTSLERLNDTWGHKWIQDCIWFTRAIVVCILIDHGPLFVYTIRHGLIKLPEIQDQNRLYLNVSIDQEKLDAAN